MIRISDFLIGCSSANLRLLVEKLIEGIEAVASQKLELERRGKSKLIAFLLKILDDQELDARMKTDGFLIKSSSTCVKFLIQDMMEKVKSVVAEKKV